MYITTLKEMESFVSRAKTSPVLAIDTEFLREKTYYPVLCLLQLATPQEVAIIDPFEVKVLGCLRELFLDPNIVKLFHAASQDMEILYNELGIIPTPIFDTQIAASLLGYGNQVGYGVLVQGECGVSLKKSDSFTDWSLRPLTPSQIAYAGDDVEYLPKIYANFRKKLESAGRLSWLDHAFDRLQDESKYNIDPREVYRRLKRSGHLSRVQLSGARELAAWREIRAQEADIPRKWVLTDEQIIEICRREARTIDDLYMVRGVKEKLPVKDAREVVKLLLQGYNLPEDQLPTMEFPNNNEENVSLQVSLMNALVLLRSRTYGIAPQTLASHDDLEALARGHEAGSPLTEGWRYDLLGRELLLLLQGRIALKLEEDKLVIVEPGPQQLTER